MIIAIILKAFVAKHLASISETVCQTKLQINYPQKHCLSLNFDNAFKAFITWQAVRVYISNIT